MKKPILIIVALLFVVFLSSSTAMAYTYGIEVGDQVKVTSYNTTAVFGEHGGEFAMLADNGYTWISYCIETEEYVSPGNYDWVGSLSTVAIKGSEPINDPMSDYSAWLYWSFYQGTLPGYTGTTQNQNDLQGLLWYLEDEITEAQWNAGKTAGMEAWLDDAEEAVDDYGWTNGGLVKVANLYETRTWDEDMEEYFYSGLRQDVLVPAVPIPPAAVLLASGLLGLVGIRRFRNRG